MNDGLDALVVYVASLSRGIEPGTTEATWSSTHEEGRIDGGIGGWGQIKALDASAPYTARAGVG